MNVRLLTREMSDICLGQLFCHTPRPLCMVSRWTNTIMTAPATVNPTKEYTMPRWRISDNGNRAMVELLVGVVAKPQVRCYLFA